MTKLFCTFDYYHRCLEFQEEEEDVGTDSRLHDEALLQAHVLDNNHHSAGLLLGSCMYNTR